MNIAKHNCTFCRENVISILIMHLVSEEDVNKYQNTDKMSCTACLLIKYCFTLGMFFSVTFILYRNNACGRSNKKYF